MRACRTLLGLFFAFFLVFPLMLATLVLISVNSWLLDRSFYEDLIDDERLYEALLDEDVPVYFERHVTVTDSEIPAEALSEALRQVITTDYLRDQTMTVLDDVFDFLEGDDYTFNPEVDLRPVKDNLGDDMRRDGPSRFAETLAAALPTCAEGQEAVAPGGLLMRCVPAGVSVEEATQDIRDQMNDWIEDIPDYVELTEPVDLRDEWEWADPTLYFAPGRDGLGFAIGVLVALTGVFWLTAAFIGGYSTRERLQWLAWSVLVPAIFIFLLGMLINGAPAGRWVRRGLDDAYIKDDVAFSEGFKDAVADAVSDARSQVGNGFLMTGAVSGALAVAGIAWSLSMPARRSRVYQPPYQQPPVNQFQQPPAPPPPKPKTPPPGSEDDTWQRKRE